MPYGDGNPQIEEGFARIANEILDNIAKTDITGGEARCIFFLWRRTYGWADPKGRTKKTDAIGYSQWTKGTGMDRRNLIRTLEGLTQKNIVTKTVNLIPGKNPVTIWSFQKRYKEWVGWHEGEVTEAQIFLPIQVVSSTPLLTDQVVSSTPPHRDQVVARIVQSSGADDTRSSGARATHNIHKDNIKTLQQPQRPSAEEFEEVTGTPSEEELLVLFESLKGWKFSRKEDLEWLREFHGTCPSFGLEQVRACRDFHSERRAKANKGSWKNRFRNWMKVEIRSEGNGSKPLVGARRSPGVLPTQQEIEKSWNISNQD